MAKRFKRLLFQTPPLPDTPVNGHVGGPELLALSLQGLSPGRPDRRRRRQAILGFVAAVCLAGLAAGATFMPVDAWWATDTTIHHRPHQSTPGTSSP